MDARQIKTDTDLPDDYKRDIVRAIDMLKGGGCSDIFFLDPSHQENIEINQILT